MLCPNKWIYHCSYHGHHSFVVIKPESVSSGQLEKRDCRGRFRSPRAAALHHAMECTACKLARRDRLLYVSGRPLLRCKKIENDNNHFCQHQVVSFFSFFFSFSDGVVLSAWSSKSCLLLGLLHASSSIMKEYVFMFSMLHTLIPSFSNLHRRSGRPLRYQK